MTPKNTSHRCKAIAKNGKPCRAAATKGGLCFFHANPDKVPELGRIGGRSKHSYTSEAATPLPTLENAEAVRNTVGRLIAEVYAGKLHTKIASGLAPLLSLQLRLIETTNLERRLTKLEKLLHAAPALDLGDLPMPVIPEHPALDPNRLAPLTKPMSLGEDDDAPKGPNSG